MPKQVKKTYNAKEVQERFAHAKTKKQHWDTILRDCYFFINPSDDSYDKPTDGEKDDQQIYDTTAVNCLAKFGASLQQSLVPPQQKWMKLIPGYDVPTDQKDDLEKLLAPLSDTIMKHIWASNFDQNILELFYDLGISTGSMLIHDTGNPASPLRFESIPLPTLYLEEGAYGEVDTVFRSYELPGRIVLQQWPENYLKAQTIKRMEKNPDAKVKLIEGTIYNPKEETYTFCIILEGGKEKVYEDEFEVSPWVVTRWDKRAGEVYGRAPGYNIIQEVKMLNLVKQFTLMNAEMAVNNIWTVVDDGTLNLDNLQFLPNTAIPVKANGGEQGRSIDVLPRNGSFDVGQLVIADSQKQIKDAFFIDDFGGVAGPTKTATEISIRNQQNLQVKGAYIGRQQNELIRPTIKRVVHILQRNGLIPQELAIDGKQIDIEIVSPIARARELDDVNNYLGFLQQANSIVPNAAAALVKPENIIWLGKAMGAPSDQLPTVDQLEAILQQAAQTAQQQLQDQPQ